MVDQRIAYRGRNVPELHPKPQRGSLEEIGSEIGLWIEATADAVSGAMLEGDHAPFSARVSQARLAEYYGSQLWDQSGNPNAQLWHREYQRVGADGLREAVDGGARWRREHNLPVVLPPPTALGAQPTPSPDEEPEAEEEEAPTSVVIKGVGRVRLPERIEDALRPPPEEALGGRQPSGY